MTIRTERKGHVLIVTIDRPEARNALSLEMSQALCKAWETLREDPNLRVAILTGAGEKAFCAGADLKEVGAYHRSLTPIERREQTEREPGLGGITRNLDPGKPIIAAIDGHCLAGGLELALACDLRIATNRARFGLPEVKRGIMPGAGGTQRLPRCVSSGLAMEMLLTGDAIDAETALRCGLINRIVPAEQLQEQAMATAEAIASNAPLAVQGVRAAARLGRHLPLDEGLRIEQLYAEPVRATEDAQEGVRAFIEKRAPRFQGK
jgi:E-phenylitaconyl-CoA hydratase